MSIKEKPSKVKSKTAQTTEELEKLVQESQKQSLPQQEKTFTVPSRIKRRAHNLPDPTRAPLGYDEHKAFDRVFPYIRLPRLQPNSHGDVAIFNAPKESANQLILGDNLEVLRTLPSESIDLIYIDPPFFSGRNYNVIWGDSNEVRSFFDIWEGGIDSYLVWLNARLWEMKRVLKKTGSIYVHCDWHASHYIKYEMDKIFGYETFQNEIIWHYRRWSSPSDRFQRLHDIILFYTKLSSGYKYNRLLTEYTNGSIERKKGGVLHRFKKGEDPLLVSNKDLQAEGVPENDVWQIPFVAPSAKERIGYPTQKPESLLERIIKASTQEGDVVADFFCGGGTTLAVAQKLNRRFIGSDSSRVAIAVTLDRLVKIGEEMSGTKSNVSFEGMYQPKLQAEGTTEKVPNIEVSYLGIYPIDKFSAVPQNDFVDFVLTCYGASRNTAEGFADGFRPPGQSEPILVGPPNPSDSIDAYKVKDFFEEIKSKLEPNKPIKAKIIGWRFSRQVQEYVEVLKQYVEKNKLLASDSLTPLIDIELISLRSSEFRRRILNRYPDAEEADLFLRFSEPPVIGDIKIKKVDSLEYQLEAIDAYPTEENSWLVNCQWDFNYQEGHFDADKDYILSRKKVRDKKTGECFEAILSANHKFEKKGKNTIACKIQDNLAGETIFSKTVVVD